MQKTQLTNTMKYVGYIAAGWFLLSNFTSFKVAKKVGTLNKQPNDYTQVN